MLLVDTGFYLMPKKKKKYGNTNVYTIKHSLESEYIVDGYHT